MITNGISWLKEKVQQGDSTQIKIKPTETRQPWSIPDCKKIATQTQPYTIFEGQAFWTFVP